MSDPADNVTTMIDTLTLAPAVRSARLLLTPLSHADLDEVHAILSDERTWRHLPSGRHTDPQQTVAVIDLSLASQGAHGCSSWSVRVGAEGEHGPIVGVGGATWSGAGCWNLGYRLTPEVWGRGFATEVARAAIVHARRAEPDAPVTARVLATNPTSARILDRVGLTPVWRGLPPRSPHIPAPGVERLVYSDRRLDRPVLEELIALG